MDIEAMEAELNSKHKADAKSKKQLIKRSTLLATYSRSFPGVIRKPVWKRMPVEKKHWYSRKTREMRVCPECGEVATVNEVYDCFTIYRLVSCPGCDWQYGYAIWSPPDQ